MGTRKAHLLADAELESLCAPSAWEQFLAKLGCFLGAAIPVTIVLLSVLRGEGSLGARLATAPLMALAGALPGALVLLYFLKLSRKRRQPFESEQDWRRGRAPLVDYTDEARTRLEGEGAPDRIVLLAARALPMGDSHWVRVELRLGSSPSGNVLVRTTLREEFKAHEAALLADEAADLARLLRANDDAVPPPACDPVMDGFPLEVLVFRRADEGERAFALNLASVRESEQVHPWVTLVRRLLAVESRVAGTEHVAGWCDANGDVRVGPV